MFQRIVPLRRTRRWCCCFTGKVLHSRTPRVCTSTYSPTCSFVLINSGYWPLDSGGFRNQAVVIGGQVCEYSLGLRPSRTPHTTMSLAVRLATRSSLSSTQRAGLRSFASSARCFQAVETNEPTPSHTATKEPLTKSFKIYRWVSKYRLEFQSVAHDVAH